MKKPPRNKAIEIVLQGHITDIQNWIENDEREELKRWLIKVLDLKNISVEDMMYKYDFYFEDDEPTYEVPNPGDEYE